MQRSNDREEQMIEIDASHGEGGGQVLRTSLALAIATATPVRFTNIRAKRPKPGLMRQHLACVHAAQAISDATVDGAELGATTLSFAPKAVRGGDYRFEISTAGSAMLVLQTVWPALLLASEPARLTLTGGTHNPLAPPYHFIERCYAPLVRRLGSHVELKLVRHGFFPAGGGEVEVRIEPGALMPFDLLERGAPGARYAEALSAALPRNVAHRELETLGRLLGWEQPQLLTPVVRQNEGPGNALMATLEYAHVTELACSLGEKSLSAEQVAKRLAGEVKDYLAHDAVCGEHLTDQWALPLALAVWKSGKSAAFTATTLSLHATTNFEIIEKFLPVSFETEQHGRGWRVQVKA